MSKLYIPSMMLTTFKVSISTIVAILFIALITFSTQAIFNNASARTITIESQQLKILQNTRVAFYSGNVKLQDDNINLTADTLKIINNPQKKIEYMVATGKPAKFVYNNEIHGKADIIKYFLQTQKIELINNSQITHEKQTITGPFISYLLEQKILTANNRTTITLERD